MTTQIDDQIREAMEKAKNAVPATVAQNANTAVANLPAGKPKTWEDAENESSIAVDHYLKVDKYGLHVGDDKAAFDDMLVEITLGEVRLGDGVRFTAGGKTSYEKTYDSVRSTTGKPWAEVLQRAQELDPGCRGAYPLAEIPMRLLEPLKLKQGDPVEKGKRVGYTTSITGYKSFISWAKDARQNFGEDTPIKVKLGWTPQKKNGNEWGEMTFTTVQ